MQAQPSESYLLLVLRYFYWLAWKQFSAQSASDFPGSSDLARYLDCDVPSV